MGSITAIRVRPHLEILLHSYTLTELVNQYAFENAEGFWATNSLQVAAFALHSGVDHALPLGLVSTTLIAPMDFVSYTEPHRFVLKIMSLLLK